MPFSLTKFTLPAPYLLVSYVDPLVLDELLASQDAIAEHLDSAPETLAVILDMHAMTRAPEGLLATFPQLLSHRALSHPRMGMRFVVLGPSLVGILANIYARIRPVLQPVDSVEEALARLIAGPVVRP